jgi:hypothetical protein
MKHRVKLAVAVAILAAASVAVTIAVAGSGKKIREDLSGYEETLVAFSTPAPAASRLGSRRRAKRSPTS